MPFLDLERLKIAPLNRGPFDFVIADNFVRAEHLPALLADFPRIRGHGSFPLSAIKLGSASTWRILLVCRSRTVIPRLRSGRKMKRLRRSVTV